MPPIEAPYKGRPAAPASADKAEATPADKPRQDETTIPNLEADKPGAPQVEESEVEQNEEGGNEEIERLTDEDAAARDAETDPNLILMRADYTKKTMALKEKERQLAERYGVYEQVDRILSDNPQLAQTYTVDQLVRLVQNGQAPDASPRPAALPPEVRAELEAMRRQVADTRQSLFADRAESAVRRVAAQYRFTPKETKELVETAVSEGLLTEDTPPEKIGKRLDLVAKAITADRAKARGQQELVSKLKEKQKAASVGTTSAPPSAAETPSAKHKGWAGLIAKHQRQYRSG